MGGENMTDLEAWPSFGFSDYTTMTEAAPGGCPISRVLCEKWASLATRALACQESTSPM